MKQIDLHVHSSRSDGTMSPSELVSYASVRNISAFALTDHDTIAGIDEAVTASSGTGVEVIPGIEFSTEYNGRDIHLVGLFIPYQNPDFCNQLCDFQDSRINRNEKMCHQLSLSGIPITLNELQERYPDSVITRAHFASYMLALGYVRSREEAFERYIGDHAPCFVPREKITPFQAVHFLRQFNAIPILAHPLLYHMSERNLDALVASLTSEGLIGLEAIYSTYSASEEREMRKLAQKYHLCISGGSDFHGANKRNIDLGAGCGHLFVPYEVLDKLREHLS